MKATSVPCSNFDNDDCDDNVVVVVVVAAVYLAVVVVAAVAAVFPRTQRLTLVLEPNLNCARTHTELFTKLDAELGGWKVCLTENMV